MRIRTHTRTARRLAGVSLSALILLTACGDDDSDVSSDDTTAESDAGSDSGNDTSNTGDEPDGEDADDGASSQPGSQCDIVPADEVAAAAGVDVVSTTPNTGTGGYQEIEFSTVGCSYEVAGGGQVRIRVLTEEAGTQLGSEVFDQLEAASEAKSMHNLEHESVPGLGEAAFFLASLGPSDTLLIDSGASGILAVLNHRDLPLSRDALKAVGEVAAQAYRLS